jgi:GNAT superfamily N-acetyltransferase
MTDRVHEATGIELDNDQSRLDLDAVERWLSVESYWARGRQRGVIARSLENSLVYGLYTRHGAHVGMFRVVTDYATFAWLCDVYLDVEVRGDGLAQWALTMIRDDLLATGVYRILLATDDAHGLYERLGFEPLREPRKWMALDTRDRVVHPAAGG